MHNPLTDNQFNENAQGLADGELDPQTSLAMNQYLLANPEKLRYIISLQLMRVQVGNTMGSDLPNKAPADLLNVIQNMAADTDTAPQTAPKLSITEPIIHTQTFNIPRQWVSVAALVIISVMALSVFKDNLFPNPISVPHTYFIDYKVADSLGSQHTKCSRKQLDLANEVSADEFSGDIAEFISKRIDTKLSINLDLTAANLDFERFGNCPLAGEGAMHLIYKAKNKPFYVSVWITPHKGNENDARHLLPNTQINTVTPFHDGSERTIVAWKDTNATYYFVGDTYFNADRAARVSLPKK